MGQRKKKLTKKKRHNNKKEVEADSDSGDFELAAEIKDDDMPGRKLPRFPTSDCLSDVEPDTRELVRAQNKKKKKSGGFQSMGLSYPVYKGVMKKGYKVPTPIQRKTIPVILDGKDVVAMARTGSGKTAAFLIPMFEKLKAPQAKTGARAVILSPTRELALQTMKFTKELGKFTGLKTALILGGDSMDDQFAALHENPDIIIGTPGRLMHVVKDMNLKLHSVEYIVFDEADRLFEMGFADQLQEIIQRLPDTRQTLLFSATLPNCYFRSFIVASMTNRRFFSPSEKRCEASEQTVVFAATKHHVEYLKELLSSEGIESAYIYSALDQTARKINIGKFVHRKAMVLLVTDVAARGIDIPLLDNVINYNFPSKAKLFLHRVGRVGRAGRSGTAYSIICPDEMPYVYDLHLFLGRPVQLATPEHKEDVGGVFGRVPQNILDDESAHLITSHENSLELQNLHRVSENAYKQYLKSRPNPSPESVRRVKGLDVSLMAVHPLLGSGLEKMELERLHIVDAIKGYKSKSTIFEINSSSKTPASEVMRAKRSRDDNLVSKFSKHKTTNESEALLQLNPKTTAEDDAMNAEEMEEENFELESGGEGTSFEQQASTADRKRKRFIRDTGKEDKKKIKTERGRLSARRAKRTCRGRGRFGPSSKSPGGPQETAGGRKIRSELKNNQQILKQRKKNQKHQFLQSGGLKKLRSKNKQFARDVKKSGFGRGGRKKAK
ncbi:hypothetical protein WMY93_020968 [Mugilogobius chulae]|uniref:RNA helicase n=1 Tax=Mugilogobius chulae TaxID=88201 RepID=A0AAW0N9D9_9GOBI